MDTSSAFDSRWRIASSMYRDSRAAGVEWPSGSSSDDLIYAQSEVAPSNIVLDKRYFLKSHVLGGGSGGVLVSASESVVKLHKILESAQAKFVELARFEYFEYGYTSSSERYLLQFASEHQRAVGELVQNIYLAEIGSSRVMLALLNSMASLGYDAVRPHGQVLAVALLSSPIAEIKEAAIRVYETWGHKEGAKILANIECPWAWLDDYRKQVIFDLGGDS